MNDNMKEDVLRVLLSEDEIREKVRELGGKITADYKNSNLMLVTVLKGAVVFLADLMRQIDVPAEIDFMVVSSYGSGVKSSGVVKIVKDLDVPLAGKDILIVEDILDSGLTLSYIKELLESRGPRSIRIATLLDKPSRRKVDLHSGGFCEALVPHVYYHGAAKPSVCAESFRIAELTSAKFLVRSETKNGFYSHAGQCGVPAIILERGGCGLLHEEEVRQDLADVKNILRGLGFLLDLPAKVYPHRLAQNGRYLDAPVSGCWYPKKQPGDRLKTGELLGEIRSIYGETLFRISAEADGVLLYQTASLGIKAGTPMIAYAEVEKEVSQ